MTTPAALAVAASLLIGNGQAAVSSKTVASAGAIHVTVEEVVDVVREARTGGDLQRLADSLSVDGLEAFASEILERKVLAAEARERGLDRDPRRARRVAAAVDTILAEAIVEEARAAIDTSDAAMRRFYTAHEGLFRTSPRRKARHIVVKTRAEAVEALAEIRAGKDFAAVASARNTDGTQATGGALGWVPRNLMVKAFEDVVFALDAGQLSEPVETHFGWHVVKVEDVDPGNLAPFELLKDKVIEAARADAVARLKATLWRRTPAVVDKAALATLLK